MQATTHEKAILIAQIADGAKGFDIHILDVDELSSVTGCFVIITGTSQNHLKAIGGRVRAMLRSMLRLKPQSIDGERSPSWLVYDYGDVIVHIMVEDAREFYGIERLWGDALPVAWEPRVFEVNQTQEIE